jgi:hypothetical protein
MEFPIESTIAAPGIIFAPCTIDECPAKAAGEDEPDKEDRDA